MQFNKLAIVLPAAALFASPIDAIAQDSQDTIEVRASSPMQQWQARTTDALNRSLARAPAMRKGFVNASIVQIAFEIDEDGRASDMNILPGDGNFTAERAALYAVRRLDTLASMPTQGSSKHVLANIIFYHDADSLRELKARLAASESARLSSRGAYRHFVAIGTAPTTVDVE